MNFIPKQAEKAVIVPYFEDANRDEGWQGYSTTKSIERLKSEIVESMTRLGAMVSGWQVGTFQMDKQKRDGYQIHYSIQTPSGNFVPGRLDIAALPVRSPYDDSKKDKSLRMALYMLRISLDGMWFMQQLSPGYAPLMPWMIANKEGKTISQLWAESPAMSRLLPPGDAEFVEGEVT
jgi:hypothetical protein